jgi:threonine aldolase
VLTFGATKNGAIGAEAVVIFDPARAWEFELRRKRAGHLPAKMRFLAAQMLGLLEDGVWLRNAARANAMADRLAAGLAAVEGVRLLHPVEANMVFADLPRGTAERLAAAGSRLDAEWRGDIARCRFVCAWSTTEAEVDALLAAL